MQAKLVVIGAGSAIFALSLVAVVASTITRDAIADTVMTGLSAVATNQRQQIESMLAHYKGDLASVANDTQIRQSLRHLNATGDPFDRFVMNQTLTDRVSSGEEGELLDIHDLDGEIVASSEPGRIGISTYDPRDDGFVVNLGSAENSRRPSDIRISTPITFDGRTIGFATVHHTGIELDEIVTRYIGRRDTGESLVVTRPESGGIRYVTPLRFNEGGDFFRTIDESNGDRVEIRSLSPVSGGETNLLDYRGKRVFAVHHYIEEADIGLIVKIDETEALSRLNGLGRGLLVTIFIVSILIVVLAVLISRRLIDPISRLTHAAEDFSRGELNARVLVESTDEVGVLGQTFNHMAGSLQTANNELEARVEERTADLKRSNQDLEQFAYVASHDLQEPLRMVSSYTQLLSRRYSGQLDSDADEFIGFAVDGAKRMQTLINDLLTYSRAGRAENTYEALSAGDIVKTALQNLADRIGSANAAVIVEELPELVADRSQLLSVFQNLISNSLKYRAASRDPKIEISAERMDRSWRFSVKDNGIGIDPAFSERIFTIFQRLHGRDEYQGTGIGLAVVKKIVERSGGSIWVESTLDEGATFIFTVVDRELDAATSEDEERNELDAAS